MCSLKKVCSTNKKACALLGEDLQLLNVDVCGVTETFLRPTIPDSFITIDGYSVFRRDRTTCRCRKPRCTQAHKGGGILVYVQSNITCEHFDSSENCESLWIKITPSSTRNVFFNVSYHPPGRDSCSLLTYLTTTVNRIDESYPNSDIFISGDFNRMDVEDLEGECGLVILDSPPTRGDARLDLILTNRQTAIDTISTFKPKVETDHLGLLIKPSIRTRPTRYTQQFRPFTSRGHRRLKSLLSQFDFQPLFLIEDVHVAAEWLENSISWCVSDAFPMKQVKMSNKDPFWFTPKIKWLLKQKKHAIRKGNEKKASIFEEKIRSEKIYSMKQRGSSSWWKGIDMITHRKHNDFRIDETAFQPEDLNLALSLRCAIQEGERREPSPTFNLEEAFAPKLTISEVMCLMERCKRTSAGPSQIPHFVFRDYYDTLAPLYLYIWNRSLSVGSFPRCYKSADLLPIPKTRNAKTVDEVRGISITSISARLFEKVVHRKWISPRITTIGDPCQFAYKQGLSTTDCLLCLQHFILLELDRAEVDGIHTLLIDYSKAFDRVNQEKAARVYDYFIESPFIRKWLYDFTTGRRQRLVWKSERLNFQPVERGCSQGTVGGPGVFSMFTDDCRAAHPSSRLLKYSDDTTCLSLCRRNPSKEEVDIFHNEVKNLLSWAKTKELEVNVEKSKIMRFCLNKSPTCQCNTPDVVFETIEEAKILGLTFQTDCSFRKHCDRLIGHLRRESYLLKDLRLSGVSLRDIDSVFESLILSRVRYGLSIYGSDENSLRKIDRFLNRCFEKKLCLTRLSIFDLLKQEDERAKNRILMNKNHPLYEYLTSYKKDRTTRHGFSNVRPYVRTKAFHKAFCNRILSS